MLTFIATRLFTSLVGQSLSGDDYAALQQALVDNPEAGDVIRGRAASGSFAGDSRAAASVAEFGSSTTCGRGRGRFWMLTLHAKNEVESIPGHVLKKIREEIDGGA